MSMLNWMFPRTGFNYRVLRQRDDGHWFNCGGSDSLDSAQEMAKGLAVNTGEPHVVIKMITTYAVPDEPVVALEW